MALKPPTPTPYPLGLISGAEEFELHFPKETMRLGSLTAYWSLVEDALCRLLAALLKDLDKAEAAFYSTTNHKARRDMVSAVFACAKLDTQAKTYVAAGLTCAKDAADARNRLLHGLFSIEPHRGELLSTVRRPVARTPEITRKGIMKELDDATSKCELAVNVLGSAVIAILYPDVFEKVKAERENREI
jgi:hypothetical protein